MELACVFRTVVEILYQQQQNVVLCQSERTSYHVWWGVLLVHFSSSSSLFNFWGLSNKLISITGFCFPGSLHRQHKSDLLLIKATSSRFAASASRMDRPMVQRLLQSWDLGKIGVQYRGRYKFLGNSLICAFGNCLWMHDACQLTAPKTGEIFGSK